MTVIELRQYTLRPGRRDELIDLFEREFVEAQEECGMRIVGTFRDLDDPDRFVWVRSFADLETRLKALTAFYGGPVWAAHRERANATMLDVSDARLLSPVRDFTVPGSRPGHGAEPPGTTLTAVVEPPSAPRRPGALAVLETLDAENDFPRLPVRTDRVRVTFTREDVPGALRLSPTGRSLLR
ncbi:NIPSNAP family protein [Actinomadura kijaniata]|uniref:NIPSNAP family protein n=1 Tax=Actinomadura kijaniata TaxID=46161 RepID=UPI00082A7C7F|nr:NIPSNAP family protein [Actinomadura kijaniata]